MSYVKSLELPRVGQPVDSARVVYWHIQPGDAFEEGDVILEIDTDKAVLEVPAEEGGTLVEQLVSVDDMIDGTTHIAKVEVAGESPASSSEAEPEAEFSVPEDRSEKVTSKPSATTDLNFSTSVKSRKDSQTTTESEVTRVLATPVARRIAAEQDIALTSITGHGPHGRIVKADVIRAVQPSTTKSQKTRVPSQPIIDEQTINTAHGELFTRVWTPESGKAHSSIVLIHGMFADLEAWQNTARSMCRIGYRVVAMDLPCHGRSRSGATQFLDVIEAVAEVVARVCTDPVVLVGHSFGAAVATCVARKPDIEITALVLIAPAGLGTDINQAFITGMTRAGSISALEREMRKLTNAGATPSGEYLKTLRDRLESQSEALAMLGREVSWSGVQQLDISSDLASLECPITIIHGRSDAIIPWEHALNAPARAALHLVPGVGHMPQWEVTGLVGEIMERVVVSI